MLPSIPEELLLAETQMPNLLAIPRIKEMDKTLPVDHQPGIGILQRIEILFIVFPLFAIDRVGGFPGKLRIRDPWPAGGQALISIESLDWRRE